MEILKTQLKRLQESSRYVCDQISKVQKVVNKINDLLPAERIAIYIHEKKQANMETDFSSRDSCIDPWLDVILEYANKRTIYDLKDDSVWELPSHKNFFRIATFLVQEIGFEKAKKLVDVIFPDILEDL